MDRVTQLNTEFHRRTGQLSPVGPLARSYGPVPARRVQTRWDELNVEHRRSFLAHYIAFAVVRPVGRSSGCRFRPDRVDFRWWRDLDQHPEPSAPSG